MTQSEESTPEPLADAALDDVQGGLSSGYIGETEKLRTRTGDGSVRPALSQQGGAQFASQAGGSPNV